MTGAEGLAALFKICHPKPVDIAQSDYEAHKAAMDAAAQAAGYRLAGYRQSRAVFTTKPQQPQQP